VKVPDSEGKIWSLILALYYYQTRAGKEFLTSFFHN
jgi:hypothetical protein